MNICPACGAKTPLQEDEFCRACGASLISETDISNRPVDDQSAVAKDPIAHSFDDRSGHSGSSEVKSAAEANLTGGFDEPAQEFADIDASESEEKGAGAFASGTPSSPHSDPLSSTYEESGFASTNEIDLEDNLNVDGTDSHEDICSDAETHEVQADDDVVGCETKELLLSSLRAKMPDMIHKDDASKEKELKSVGPDSISHFDESDVYSIDDADTDHQGADADVSHESFAEVQVEDEPPGSFPLPEIENRNNRDTGDGSIDMPLPSSPDAAKGDAQNRAAGFDSSIVGRLKRLDYKTKILYGAIAVIVLVLIGSQFVHRGDTVLSPPLMGVVVHEGTGRVLQDVKVTVHELGISVMSDHNGMFHFDEVPEGSYTITGETPFFKTASLTFRHGRENQTLLSVAMSENTSADAAAPPKEISAETEPAVTKKYGDLKITMDVAEAQLFLDNLGYGTGSRTINRVLEGRHKLVIEAEGYETFEETVSIEENRVTRVEASLVRIKPDKPPEMTAADFVRAGDSAAAAGDLTTAINSYGRALDKEREPETYYRRAQTYHKTGKLSEAAKDFMRAGNSFTSIGQITSAIGSYNAVLDLFPNDMRALRARGYAYTKRGEYELAIADFVTACDLDKNDYQNQLGLGNAYSIMGRYKDAIKAYKKAEKLTEDRSEVYALIALASLSRGKEKDARKYYEKFLEEANPQTETRFSSDPEWQRLKQMASADD